MFNQRQVRCIDGLLDNVQLGPSNPQPRGVRDAPLARSRGFIDLSFKLRGQNTVVEKFFQSGCAKIRLPRTEQNAYRSAILINTAGGWTGGDRLDCSVHWAAGARACVAGQAAEKVYRALDGDAVVETRLKVEAGARAEWLPQQTIVFDRGRLHRDTLVTLAADSWFLGLEAIVLGRAAMGESVHSGKVRDGWRLIRNGKLIYADALRLEGAIAARMSRQAIGDGARAFATLVHAAPDAATRLDDVRAALASSQGAAGASAWDGVLVARFLANDGDDLKRDIVRALQALRGGRPLPRVWTC